MIARPTMVLMLMLTQQWGGVSSWGWGGTAWAKDDADSQSASSGILGTRVEALVDTWRLQPPVPETIAAEHMLTVDRLIGGLQTVQGGLVPALAAEAKASGATSAEGLSPDKRPVDETGGDLHTSDATLSDRDAFRKVVKTLNKGVEPLRELRAQLTSVGQELAIQVDALATFVNEHDSGSALTRRLIRRRKTLETTERTVGAALESTEQLSKVARKTASRAELAAERINSKVAGRTVEGELALHLTQRASGESGGSAEPADLLQPIREARDTLAAAYRRLASTAKANKESTALVVTGQFPVASVRAPTEALRELEQRFDRRLAQYNDRQVTEVDRIVSASETGDRVAALGNDLLGEAMQAVSHDSISVAEAPRYSIEFKLPKTAHPGHRIADGLAPFVAEYSKCNRLDKFRDRAQTISQLLNPAAAPEEFALGLSGFLVVERVFHRANERWPGGGANKALSRVLGVIATSTLSTKVTGFVRTGTHTSTDEGKRSLTTIVRDAMQGPFEGVVGSRRWDGWIGPFARKRPQRSFRADRVLERHGQ